MSKTKGGKKQYVRDEVKVLQNHVDRIIKLVNVLRLRTEDLNHRMEQLENAGSAKTEGGIILPH